MHRNGGRDMLFDSTEVNAKYLEGYGRIYAGLADAYTRFIDGLGRRFGTSPFWWCSTLASRDVYITDALADIVTLLLIIRHLKNRPQIKEVLVEKESIAKDLGAWAKANGRALGVSVKTGKAKKKRPAAIKHAAGFMQWGWFTLTGLRRKGYIQRYRGKDNPGQEPFVLIQTDVFEGNFDTGQYEARDFANLMEYADGNVRLLPYFFLDRGGDNEGLIRNCCHEKKYRFVFREEHLGLRDYLSLLLYPVWCGASLRRDVRFRGVDVTHIIREDLMRSAWNGNCWHGLLNYRLFGKLAQKGIKIPRFIDWFEGQPSSAGAFMGYHRNYPQGTGVAYVGVPVDTANVGLFASEMQKKAGAAPDEYAVIGKIFREIFQKKAKRPVILAPPFRMQGFFVGTVSGTADGKEGSARQKRLLASLSYFREQSSAMIRMLDGIAGYLTKSGIHVLFKNHPTQAGCGISDYGVEGIGFSHEFIAGDYRAAVEKSDVVFFSKSTVGYETVLYGKPVIMMDTDGLSFPAMPEEWKGVHYEVAYDSRGLERHLRKFMDGGYRRVEVGTDGEHIVRATKESVGKLLGK